MIEISSIFTSSSEISPFFFWIVISYLIFLFFSFNIEEIKLKVNGVELLFISVASGIIFYFIYEILEPFVIEPLILWYNDLNNAVKILPFGPNPIIPGLNPPLTTSSDYFAIGLVLFTVIYFIFIFLFFIYIKIIKYCLDPSNQIFQKYERFSLLIQYNVIRICSLGIPLIIFFIGSIILFSGLIYGYFSYMFFFGYTSIRGLLVILSSILWILLALISIIIFIVIIYSELCLFKPIFEKVCQYLHISSVNLLNFFEISKINQNRVSLFIKIHLKWFFYIITLLMIIIVITNYLYPIHCTESYCIY